MHAFMQKECMHARAVNCAQQLVHFKSAWAAVACAASTVHTGTDQRFKRLKVDGVHIGVSVWDTAGQDRFQSLTPM
jgi:GTPase SAR1 family protein